MTRTLSQSSFGLPDLVRNLPSGVVVVDRAGRPVDWNASAAWLLGWPAQPGLGNGVPRLGAGEPRWIERLGAKAGLIRPATLTLRHERDGRRILVRVTASRRPESHSHLVLVVEDVTPRARLRLRARRARHRLRDLLEGMPDPVALCRRHTIVFANGAARSLLRVPDRDALVGRSITEIVQPDARLDFERRLDRLAAGESSDFVEHRCIAADGESIAVDIAATALAAPGTIAVFLRNAAPRKRAEASVQAARERFRLLAETVRDYAIVMLDAGGVVLSWNPAAERLTGYRTDEAVGRRADALFRPVADDDEAGAGATPADWLEPALRVARETGRHDDDGWRVRKDGTRIWTSTAITPLVDPERNVIGYALIVRDLTERRDAEIALRRSEEHLRQAQKLEAIGRIAGGVSHDFNNLLTAIQGHAQFLLEDLPPTSSTYADAEEIKRAADRAAELTRQLLSFSRRHAIEPKRLDVNEVVRQMHRLLRRVIREDIAIDLDLAETLEPVFMDAGQLEQVVLNLAVNGRDAIPREGRIRIATRQIELRRATGPDGALGHFIEIAVTDTGIGMDEQTRLKIFEPFFTTKPPGSGTGLGLATVHGITKAAGGHVVVESRPGHGSTFRVRLPVYAASGAGLADPAPAELARGAESVLLVQPDDETRAAASLALQKRGYGVLEAATGSTALRLAGEYDAPIDLVLTEIVTPEMSGRRLVQGVRALHPHARVLYVSSVARNEAVRQGLIDADARFIERPFTPERLALSIRETLDTETD